MLLFKNGYKTISPGIYGLGCFAEYCEYQYWLRGKVTNLQCIGPKTGPSRWIFFFLSLNTEDSRSNPDYDFINSSPESDSLPVPSSDINFGRLCTKMSYFFY
jgi:hypothetical protein